MLAFPKEPGNWSSLHCFLQRKSPSSFLTRFDFIFRTMRWHWTSLSWSSVSAKNIFYVQVNAIYLLMFITLKLFSGFSSFWRSKIVDLIKLHWTKLVSRFYPSEHENFFPCLMRSRWTTRKLFAEHAYCYYYLNEIHWKLHNTADFQSTTWARKLIKCIFKSSIPTWVVFKLLKTFIMGLFLSDLIQLEAEGLCFHELFNYSFNYMIRKPENCVKSSFCQ